MSELENPYNRTTEPELYQQWYYENVTKQKRREAALLEPKNYFKNKTGYTHIQKKLNRGTRPEQIEILFLDKQDYHYARYLKYRGRDGEIHDRSRTEAKAFAEENYYDDLKFHQESPVIHHMMNILDEIRQNKAFNMTEAWTLWELTWRWTWSRADIQYKQTPQEITVTEDELFSIIPKKRFMDPVNPVSPNSIDKTYASFYKDTMTIQQLAEKLTNERVGERELYLENGLKALSKLKDNWIEATNETFTPLIYTHNGHTYRSINGVNSWWLDAYDHIMPISLD